MDKDVTWWIKTCEVCQRRKRPNRPPKAPMKKYVSGFPNERVAMDVMGAFKESKNGNKYVLCITDHFSKYSRAFPMPDQVSTRVAEIFVKEWIYMWGEPMSLHTDRGTNFESELLAQVCKLMKIAKTRTTAYHPQGNAQVERYNQSVMDIVAKLTDKETYDDWDEQLPISVAAYNATEHSTTGFTPNRLMFNREMMHNFDKMLPECANQEELQTWDVYVQNMDDLTRRAFQAAREAIGRSVFLQKKHYDKNSNLIHYSIGDSVRIKDHRLLEGGTRKLADRYDRPYFVLDVLSDVNFRVTRSSDDRPQIIHHDRMEKIDLREKPDISWVFKQSRTFQRSRAQQGNDGETMKEVLDRLTKLENKQKESKRKRRRKDDTRPKPADVEPQPAPRKRGRPRKTDIKSKPKAEPKRGERRSERLRQKRD